MFAQDNTPPFWISACAGGVSMILAGFGFFGTKKKNMSMLLVYITLELVVSLVRARARARIARVYR